MNTIYTVTQLDKDTQQETYSRQFDKEHIAIGFADHYAIREPGHDVYIEFYRSTDGQSGYINQDGADISGKPWRFDFDKYLQDAEVVTEDIGDGETCRFKRQPIGKGTAVELSESGEGVLILRGGDEVGYEFYWNDYIAELIAEIDNVTVIELLDAVYIWRREI